MVSALAQRAASEGPRWTRATETTPAASPDRGKELGNRSLDARSEEPFGSSLIKRNKQAWRDQCIEENHMVDGHIGRDQHGLS